MPGRPRTSMFPTVHEGPPRAPEPGLCAESALPGSFQRIFTNPHRLPVFQPCSFNAVPRISLAFKEADGSGWGLPDCMKHGCSGPPRHTSPHGRVHGVSGNPHPELAAGLELHSRTANLGLLHRRQAKKLLHPIKKHLHRDNHQNHPHQALHGDQPARTQGAEQ